MTGTVNLGDEWSITTDPAGNDLVIRHNPTGNDFRLGADGTFTPLPELAVTSVTTVPDKSARLSVTAQEGDIVIQTNVNKTFVLTTSDPTQDSNWIEVQVDTLNTIDGQTITPSQVGTSSSRADVVADSIDTNSLTGSASAVRTRTRAFLSSNSSASPVPFDSVSYDPDSNFDTSTNEYSVPEDGVYLLSANFRLASTVSSGASAGFRIRVNGQSRARGEIDGTDNNPTVSITDVRSLNQGDTITVENGQTVSLTGFASDTFFLVIGL